MGRTGRSIARQINDRQYKSLIFLQPLEPFRRSGFNDRNIQSIRKEITVSRCGISFFTDIHIYSLGPDFDRLERNPMRHFRFVCSQMKNSYNSKNINDLHIRYGKICHDLTRRDCEPFQICKHQQGDGQNINRAHRINSKICGIKRHPKCFYQERNVKVLSPY